MYTEVLMLLVAQLMQVAISSILKSMGNKKCYFKNLPVWYLKTNTS